MTNPPQFAVVFRGGPWDGKTGVVRVWSKDGCSTAELVEQDDETGALRWTHFVYRFKSGDFANLWLSQVVILEQGDTVH